MKIPYPIAGIVLILAFVGSLVVAADRKEDGANGSITTTKAVQQKANAQPPTSPISPTSQTKSSQVQPSAAQPAPTDATSQQALKAPLAGEQIKWQVVSGGGNRSTSTNFALSATVGQTAVGLASSINFKANQGFWQNFSGGGCCLGRTGNVDCDATDAVDISDLSALIDNLYISLTPLCCQKEANVDGSVDGNIDISDLSALIDYLYISFTPPAACK